MERQTSLEPPAGLSSSTLGREVVRDANQWLVRFTPLLDESDSLHADECRERLRAIPSLRDSGDRVRLRLQEHGDATDAPLLATLEGAVRELDALEDDLRRRLARLAPNDPQASADLDSIQDRLAAAAAKREVEAVAGPISQNAGGLEVRTSNANWGAALFMALFSFGWLSFTTVHAFMMLGEMRQSLGWAALGLLGFYAIFFAVGIGMAWGAVLSASDEHLTVEGDELVLTRKLLGLVWRKRHALGDDSRAEIGHNVTRSDSGSSISSYAYVMNAQGREIKFGVGRPEPELKRVVSQLNEYLEARRNWRAHA